MGHRGLCGAASAAKSRQRAGRHKRPWGRRWAGGTARLRNPRAGRDRACAPWNGPQLPPRHSLVVTTRVTGLVVKGVSCWPGPALRAGHDSLGLLTKLTGVAKPGFLSPSSLTHQSPGRPHPSGSSAVSSNGMSSYLLESVPCASNGRCGPMHVGWRPDSRKCFWGVSVPTT